MISRRTLDLAALACKAQALAAADEADALLWERAALECSHASAHLLLTATPPPAAPIAIPTLPPDVWAVLGESESGALAGLDALDQLAGSLIVAPPVARGEPDDALDF